MTGKVRLNRLHVLRQKIERYNKGADAIQALKLGKIDCVVIDEQPGLQFVKQNSNIRIIDEEYLYKREYSIQNGQCPL